jgi:geranylgeranyl reductase family protein
MKRVAVLGGGPAGSFAAERLASAGLSTILLDEKLAWEKPCGGGLTYKAYSQYPFLLENDTPKRIVTQTNLCSANADTIQMTLQQPLVIYSRFDLNRMLLVRAERAGAQIEQERVLGIERTSTGWNIRTRRGILNAGYCVLATGARNPLRDVGTKLTAADTMCTLGYYVPSAQEHIEIRFLPGLEGYIWVFPRAGHLSVGICGKGEPAHALRTRLEEFMRQREISRKDASFYSHLLPSLESPSWRQNRVSGDGWCAVGDAAGLVDPITGEGLYYAIRSGNLAADVILDERHEPDTKAHAYRELLRRDFAADLEFGAMLAKRFFVDRFLFGTVPTRMIQLTRRSPSFAAIVQDLFSGTQPYLDLKRRLLANMNGTVQDIITNFILGHLFPSAARAGISQS